MTSFYDSLEAQLSYIKGVKMVSPYKGQTEGALVDFEGDTWHDSSLRLVCLEGEEECYIYGDLVVPANRSSKLQQKVQTMGCNVDRVHQHTNAGPRQTSLMSLNDIRARGADHVHPLCHTKSRLGAAMLLRDLVELTVGEQVPLIKLLPKTPQVEIEKRYDELNAKPRDELIHLFESKVGRVHSITKSTAKSDIISDILEMEFPKSRREK